MQYQLVLILFNIVTALAAYFLLRDRRHIFRLVIMPIVYAYLLAAFLPYLLAYVPVKWVIVFYTIAILLGFLAKGIDSRVQPDADIESLNSTARIEADLAYAETCSEREALINAVQVSRANAVNGVPLYSNLLPEPPSSTPGKNSSSFEVRAGALASASNHSKLVSADKSSNSYTTREKISSISSPTHREAPDAREQSTGNSLSSLHPVIQQKEKPAHTAAYIYGKITPDLKTASIDKPHHTSVPEIDEKDVIEPGQPASAQVPLTLYDEISTPYREETYPETESSAPVLAVVTGKTEEEQLILIEENSETEQAETAPLKENEIQVVAANNAAEKQSDLVLISRKRNHIPPAITKTGEISHIIAAPVLEAPTERHRELVEASSEQYSTHKESEKSEGVESLLTNQQIPVKDAGEMVLDKESIIDQQEATEDDLMQLDLELVIDRAFQAKFSSDYKNAIRIFEVALNRTPSPKLARMIADDIEVMRSKLA